MAIVRKLEKLDGITPARHTEAQCTYAIVRDDDGKSYLQVDTYGSATRQIRGKKSQSIRFSPEAVVQLRRIIESELR